jgi:hypothetical protein
LCVVALKGFTWILKSSNVTKCLGPSAAFESLNLKSR